MLGSDWDAASAKNLQEKGCQSRSAALLFYCFYCFTFSPPPLPLSLFSFYSNPPSPSCSPLLPKKRPPALVPCLTIFCCKFLISLFLQLAVVVEVLVALFYVFCVALLAAAGRSKLFLVRDTLETLFFSPFLFVKRCIGSIYDEFARSSQLLQLFVDSFPPISASLRHDTTRLDTNAKSA